MTETILFRDLPVGAYFEWIENTWRKTEGDCAIWRNVMTGNWSDNHVAFPLTTEVRYDPFALALSELAQ
jgi:hypothetical protein